jgi:hypothetical protein
MRLWRRAFTGLGVVAASAVVASAALASTSPSLALDQGAGHAAGSTTNLGLNLAFSNTGTDSPKNLALNLPPGLLANAAVNGGQCLQRVDLTDTACQVGSGTVTATPDLLGLGIPLSASVPVTFHLVPPPSPGDLAGLAVYTPLLGEQLGSTGDIVIRPSGDPNGVGATIKLALPDELPVTLLGGQINVAQVSITSIASTFSGLRYPATCPSSPAHLTASVNSYQDATSHPLSATLTVTGCGSLSYSPKFSVSAKRDSGDRQVTLSTNITQGASEAPNRSVALAFPTSVLGPNLAATGALCLNLSSGCTAVGSVTAASPLYPKPLSGTAYLTGNGGGLALTLVFPSPFPLTLTGAVDLQHNSATFTGLPDIPLTSLQVTLNGGAKGLFLTTCASPSGTATATLADQNGDRSAKVPATFTVAGCAGSGGGSGSGGSGGSGGGSGSGGSAGSGGNGSTSTGVTVRGTRVSKARISGLKTGRPSLIFGLGVVRHNAKLKSFTVELPKGLSFARHRVHKKLKVTGVSLQGAKLKSATLSKGHLVITLRKAVSSLTVRIRSSALKESAALRRKARTTAKAKKLKSLKLTVITRNSKNRRTTVRVQIRNLGL